MTKQANPQQLESLYLDLPHVFNYSPTSNIQFATKAFTPININLEIVASDPTARSIVINKLLTETNNYDEVDYICGIESGGSYFASAIADKHKKKLILLRRRDKIEDLPISKLVGEIPPKGSRICLVDDVLSTGLTLSHACKFLKDLGCVIVEAKIIYSYGYEKEISKRLKLDISVISNYNTLINLAISRNIISTSDAQKLNKYVKTFKGFLARIK